MSTNDIRNYDENENPTKIFLSQNIKMSRTPVYIFYFAGIRVALHFNADKAVSCARKFL